MKLLYICSHITFEVRASKLSESINNLYLNFIRNMKELLHASHISICHLFLFIFLYICIHFFNPIIPINLLEIHFNLINSRRIIIFFTYSIQTIAKLATIQKKNNNRKYFSRIRYIITAYITIQTHFRGIN